MGLKPAKPSKIKRNDKATGAQKGTGKVDTRIVPNKKPSKLPSTGSVGIRG